MKKMKRMSRLLALALCASLALSSCGGGGGNTEDPAGESNAPAGETSAQGGGTTVDLSTKDELIVAISTEPGSLDPHNVNMVTAFTIGKQIFDHDCD